MPLLVDDRTNEYEEVEIFKLLISVMLLFLLKIKILLFKIVFISDGLIWYIFGVKVNSEAEINCQVAVLGLNS